jgi:hypothetical protein
MLNERTNERTRKITTRYTQLLYRNQRVEHIFHQEKI